MNISSIFKRETTKKIITLLCIALLLYIMRGLLNLFLFTFIFSYLIYSLQKMIMNSLGKIIKLRKTIVTLILYTLLFFLIVFSIYKYIPLIANQIVKLIDQASDIKGIPKNNKILNLIMAQVNSQKLESYVKSSTSDIIDLAKNIGQGSIYVFMSLILSMFLILEIDEVKNFMRKIRQSKLGVPFGYIEYFARIFLNSFGKVIQAQLMIALVNTGLSVVALSIMGFPQILGLGVMIFVLSLIPVAGVIISLVPLSVIAYSMHGPIEVVYVIIMVVLLHILESYVLNPKLMAVKTKLPVFVTFMVLIVSEHFMGVWGLLLGIPIFMFILDLLGINVIEPNKNPRQVKAVVKMDKDASEAADIEKSKE